MKVDDLAELVAAFCRSIPAAAPRTKLALALRKQAAESGADNARLVTILRRTCADSPEVQVRYHAQRLLQALPALAAPGKLRDASDPSCLGEALESDNPGWRLLAIQNLGKLPKQAAGELVLQAIRRPETDAWVLAALSSALGFVGGEETAEEAAGLLEHESPRVAANALLSLFRIEPTTARYAAQWRIQSEDNRLRTNAVLVLYGASPDIAWAQVRDMAASPFEWMRASASFLASQLVHPESEALLLAMALGEEQPEILARILAWLGARGTTASAGTLYYWTHLGEAVLRPKGFAAWTALRSRLRVDPGTARAAGEELQQQREKLLADPSRGRVAPVVPEAAPRQSEAFDLGPGGSYASQTPVPTGGDPVGAAEACLLRGEPAQAVALLKPHIPTGDAEAPTRFLWVLARAFLDHGDVGNGVWWAGALDPTELNYDEVYVLARALEGAGAIDSACGAYGYLQGCQLGFKDVEQRHSNLMAIGEHVPEELLLLFSEHYREVRPLAEGGMGRVFLAKERVGGREVALKVPHAVTLEDPRQRERFMKEMQALAGVRHPNVVPLVQVHLGARPFYSMEVVEGADLDAVVAKQGKLAPPQAVPLLRGIASAMAFLHGLGIVHQDLKPENVLVDEHGIARLSDFGLAVEVGREFDSKDWVAAGSPVYMAPEQFSASPPHPAADVYSFGVLAFQCLSGELPFPEENPFTKVYTPPPKLAEKVPNIPPALAALVDSCLSREIKKRPTNGTEVLQALG